MGESLSAGRLARSDPAREFQKRKAETAHRQDPCRSRAYARQRSGRDDHGSRARRSLDDRANFETPHQLAVGVKHVFVNGAQVLKDGEPTGAKPGRALWGPGKINQSSAAAQAKPSPPPAHWRGLIGEYGPDNDLLYVLEKDGKLCALFKRVELETLEEISPSVFNFSQNGPRAGNRLIFTRDAHGRAIEIKIGDSTLRRRQ